MKPLKSNMDSVFATASWSRCWLCSDLLGEKTKPEWVAGFPPGSYIMPGQTYVGKNNRFVSPFSYV